MPKLLPLLLALTGLAGGILAGHLLKPAPAAPENPAAPAEHAPAAAEAPGIAAAPGDPLAPAPPHDAGAHWEYVKLDNQFVVPVMGEGRVAALIVLSISLEIAEGGANEVFAREPKLRDAFLRVLFEHERSGGFTGIFTDARVMAELRGSLRQAAKAVLGGALNDVLVTDILRQDV